MKIQEACDLLKKELLNNGYEYGFYLNGKTYKRKNQLLNGLVFPFRILTNTS
jgi:hypothetical protein